jgi:hypothetical protein
MFICNAFGSQSRILQPAASVISEIELTTPLCLIQTGKSVRAGVIVNTSLQFPGFQWRYFCHDWLDCQGPKNNFHPCTGCSNRSRRLLLRMVAKVGRRWWRTLSTATGSIYIKGGAALLAKSKRMQKSKEGRKKKQPGKKLGRNK